MRILRELLLGPRWDPHTKTICSAKTGNLAAIILSFLVASILVNVPASRGQAGTASEYSVKAAFLYNFTKFVEWPAGSFSNEKSPITLCILGDDPFGDDLDGIVQGKVSNNRPLVIRRLSGMDGVKLCQLVFVGASEDKRLAGILDVVKGRSELVVGESEDFARRGGDIQFFLEDNRVHFAVNVDAIGRSHLTVSSRLLALAKIVHDENRPGGN